MNAVKDSIERVVTLPVSIERAWTAITEPAEVRQWFGEQSDYELREGAEGLFKWGDQEARMRIVTIKPPHRFAYRWIATSDDDYSIAFEDMPATLVEYELESIPDGTRLTLTESGFSSLPEHLRDGSFADNSEGWISELAKLVTYTGTLVAV